MRAASRRRATSERGPFANLPRERGHDALVARALMGATQGVMQVAITAPQNQNRRNHDQDQRDHQQ